MKFRLTLCAALLAFGGAPMVSAQQVYHPATGVPVVSPQQAHQAVAYNMPMASAMQPGMLGCDNNACDTNAACDSNGCDSNVRAGGLLSHCGGQLYDPCCPNVYVSVYGGWADFNTGNELPYAMTWLTTDPTTQVTGAGAVNYGTHEEFGFGVSAGRTLGRRFRGEMDFTWRRGQVSSLNDFQSATWPQASGQVNVYSLMPNLLMDLNPDGLINFYGGAGGGLAFTNIEFTSGNAGYELNNSSFAYQIIAGVSTRLSQRAHLFAEYRYFRTDHTGIDTVDALTNDGLALETGEFVSNDYFIGVRINRW
ncbi:MAG: porin family protein [Mariniblastus sp.]|nr:porin family protein [Mariniblastus sp.]